MKHIIAAVAVLFASQAWSASLPSGTRFSYQSLSAQNPTANITSDGDGDVLIIDAMLDWGTVPTVTFDDNTSACQVESIEVGAPAVNLMVYRITVKATQNTDFGGCTLKVRQHDTEYSVVYGFWTS